MDTLVGAHHTAAEEMCRQLAVNYPGHPGAVYARASALYAQMVDFEDSSGRAEFMALTDSVARLCDTWKLQQRGDRAKIAFLKGSALASRGLLLHHEGRTLPGLRSLISAKGEFDEAIDVNPEFYDAYLGRGAYRYGVARNAGVITWLPFIPSAKSGWDDMWQAVERSRFSRWSALTVIVGFAIDDKDFTLADSICAAGLARFPHNRSFLFPKLALAVRRGQWNEAEITAHDLLAQFLALPGSNGYEATGLYWRLMRIADADGRPADAVNYARAGVATYRTPDAARRRKDKLTEMESRLAR